MGQQDDGLEIARVTRHAAKRERWAWDRLVGQYERLIWAMTRDFQLMESDAADVVQITWLRLLENIDRLESPEHVGSWLATTARRECMRWVTARERIILVSGDVALSGAATQEPQADERILAEDLAREVREALSRLPGRWQNLLELLMADQPPSYAEISDRLGVPVGSIGPTRARCLSRLRTMLDVRAESA